MANCFKCQAVVVFDDEHIGKNGRKIPLDPATHTPHDCPMRESKVKWDSGMMNTPLGKEEDKDDHGNETVYDITRPKPEYVDHTQGQKLKLKTITDPTPEGMDLKYNRFAAEQNIRWSQSHVTGSQYTMFVWYEEVTA